MPDLPEPRQYFSQRRGRGPKAAPLPFASVRRLVISIFDDLDEKGYMQQAFGYGCVDAGDVNGTLGHDPDAYFLRTIMREGIWPYHRPVRRPSPSTVVDAIEKLPQWQFWDEDTTFDVIEVVHDLVAAPVDGYEHTYNDCGWHYTSFNRTDGQREFRRQMNAVLALNDPPYELNGMGELIETGPTEFKRLLDAPVPEGTEHDLITSKIDAAVTEFRARGATIDARRHAVRDLADVLEALRPDIKASMLTADEGALFQLANTFAIRHNNRDQRGDYDKLTWLRWAFYVYLATIHAVLRVRTQQRENT